MQFAWLNKKNNKKLIIFFAGWSFDEKPFKFLDCKDYDVLFVYDYNQYSELPATDVYREKYLITWSMGVFTAYKYRNKLPKFDKKIAINGTPFPVDDEFGIPNKPFILTLRHAKTGLEGKFYQNIFNKQEEYQKYIENPVERSIENRINELNQLYTEIKKSGNEYHKFYDLAFVSTNDKIIPSKNQLNFWNKYNTPVKQLESGHFPYYNYISWKELL